MSLLRNGLTAVQDIGGLLIERGTAMGPLVPSLLLVPVFIGAAWWFRSEAVIGGIPIFTALFIVAALAIVFSYHRHYTSFAKNDPDRLQSEKYRYETARMQMIAAKELRQPMAEDRLPWPGSVENPVEGGKSEEEAQPTVVGEPSP